MIVCSGCSKSGTHFLTSLMKAMGKRQIGGTLIKRPTRPLHVNGKSTVAMVFAADDTHFIHAHLIHRAALAQRLRTHRHLFVIRHPRNIAISWMRHRTKENPELTESETFLSDIIRGGMFGRAVPQFISYHLPWLATPETCCVRFEDLVARDAGTLAKIARAVDVAPDPAQYETAFGEGSTYTSAFSDWRTNPHWGDMAESAWQKTGGAEVERVAGYG